MLISQIVQLDAQSNEFARRNAASQIGRSDGGESFADYLAATMNPETSRSESRETAISASDRTPERAHRQEAPAEESADARAAREADRSKPGKPREADMRSEDSAGPASREEKSKSEATEVPVKKSREEESEADEATPAAGPTIARDLAGEAVSAIPRRANGEMDEDASVSGKKSEVTDKAARVSSRRVSENEVEIDVTVDLDKTAATKASASARKSSDSTEAPEDSESKGLSAKELVADRTQKKSARDSLEERAETASVLRSKPEKAEKTSDSDDRSTRVDRRVEVRDLRSERGRGRNNGDARDGGDGRRSSGETAVGDEPASDIESRNLRPTADRVSQFETLRAEGGPTSPASRGSEPSARAMSGTAANLRQTLQESLNAEIVRSARLVVRGDGRGEIRLNLRPDSLGNVRISLQMQDGHIAGRIIVDNQTVREVFEQNLASLQKAFEDSGLEAGGVEISLADSGDQAGQSPDEAPQRASVREIADRFGYSVPDLSTIDEYHDLVDVVV